MSKTDPEAICKKLSVGKEFQEKPGDWLGEQGFTYGLSYLLVHADDGVIWGKVDGRGGLHLAPAALSVPNADLRLSTLQQARLFGPPGELLIWNTGGGFTARLILDEETESNEMASYEERHLLWGQAGEEPRAGFTPMVEGAEGLRHSPPLELSPGKRACLKIRHYLKSDAVGQVFIAFSRLVDLQEYEGGEA